MRLDPWPEAPELPGPVIMDQQWMQAVFLHWRIPELVAAAVMPPGVAPDNFDGSAWVGLIGFRMRGAGLGRGPGVPYFGNFTEVNVRLYSREPNGTRGVVFLTLDASRLAPVLAARAAGIPYVWSRTRSVGAGKLPGRLPAKFVGVRTADTSAVRRSAVDRSLCPSAVRTGAVRRSYAAPSPAGTTAVEPSAPASVGYSVRRFRGGARSDFAVVPEPDVQARDPLSIHLTARFGLHSRFRGRTVYVPNTHSAWPLYPAQLTHLDDQLVRAAGIQVTGTPESVLFSPGVHTQFGRPRVLDGSH